MGSILVTGAAGNVGRQVMLAGRARGLPVIAALRKVEDGSVPSRRLDFEDRATWAPALEGVDRLFLLRPPAISNVEETLNPLVTLAFAQGVHHVVFLSVQGAQDQPRVPHHAVEKHLRVMGRGYTLLRPGFFAQNFQDAYRRDIVEDNRVYVPAGNAQVAFVDARDLGEVAARILENPAPHDRAAYTLTGPRTFTFQEAATILSSVLGQNIRYQPASVLAYALHLWRHQNLPAMQVLIQTYLHVGLRKGDAALVDMSLSTLLERPARSLRDYLVDEASTWAAPAPS